MSPPTHTPGLQPCLLLLVLSSTGPTAPCFPAGLSVSTLCSSAREHQTQDSRPWDKDLWSPSAPQRWPLLPLLPQRPSHPGSSLHPNVSTWPGQLTLSPMCRDAHLGPSPQLSLSPAPAQLTAGPELL